MSVASLSNSKRRVPTLLQRVAHVSCVHIVYFFIGCFLTGFPETVSDPLVPGIQIQIFYSYLYFARPYKLQSFKEL